MKKLIILLFLLPLLATNNKAAAQWFLDTATPEEATVRDQPFRYLENEIQQKLCDQNLGIDQDNNFKFLTDNPDWRLVLRGKGIHRFNFTDDGGICIIKLKENSSAYKTIFNRQVQLSQDLSAAIQAGKAKIGGPEDKKEDRLNQQLEDDKQFVQIHVTLNDDRVQGKELQDFRAARVMQIKNIPGVQQTVLYCEYPEEDDPDTTYRAVLYLGNFPKYSGKMVPVHFKSYRSEPWTDKQHSGAPVIENISIGISGYQYNRMMKVIHNIDWAGLDKFIK